MYQTRLGLGPGALGFAVTLTLLSSAVMTYLVRWPAERYGVRTALLLGAGFIAVSAGLFYDVLLYAAVRKIETR